MATRQSSSAKYLAVLFCADPSSGETMSVSRVTESKDPRVVARMFAQELHMGKDELNTILLIRNGHIDEAPNTVHSWEAGVDY